MFVELEFDVYDDAELYAERFNALAAVEAERAAKGRKGEEGVCHLIEFCGGEFGDEKCVLAPDLNPLIETSGDTLTIGFKAEGLLPWTVRDEITTCDKYDSETGACDSATVALGEPPGFAIVKELFTAAAGELGCDGNDLRADGAFLLGPSWKEIIDSTDHWLEHLKEGFAFTIDLTGNQDAVNAMYDQAVAIELREDGSNALDDAFPRELFALWEGNWLSVELSNEAIDDLIDAWPDVNRHLDADETHFAHPDALAGAGSGASGVFSEDIQTIFGVEYEYLRDYRSPYADVSELWEGAFEEQVQAN